MSYKIHLKECVIRNKIKIQSSTNKHSPRRTYNEVPKNSPNKVSTPTIKLSYLHVIILLVCSRYLFPPLTSASSSSSLCLHSDYTPIAFNTGKRWIFVSVFRPSSNCLHFASILQKDHQTVLRFSKTKLEHVL
jgi:hypothetical protein